MEQQIQKMEQELRAQGGGEGSNTQKITIIQKQLSDSKNQI